MHDFQITENFVIFFDLPLVFELVDGSAFPMRFRPEYGARIGVMPRAGTNADVQWFDIDPCYLFHTYNAYEVNDEVIVEGSRLDSFWADGFSPVMPAGRPWRWRLNRGTGSVNEGQFFDTLMDFPVIDRRVQGMNYQMLYGLRQVPSSNDYPLHPDGIIKFNRNTSGLEQWVTGDAAQPDEPVFVPSREGHAEDEGWLMSMVYNRADDRSEVVILDAQRVSDEAPSRRS